MFLFKVIFIFFPQNTLDVAYLKNQNTGKNSYFAFSASLYKSTAIFCPKERNIHSF